ncbi:hypothetical protein SAMN06265171_101693 [Chryseobacterium rhizoplanae]|uniref:Conjugal transfer protein TraD n=1 Tax=Chryseobacterium rhizoplanae TaxID=1609531 RepID=A0A521B6F1_9FLAO|nr:hypothetical protein [Chryseobacterium rhizoplanae]SMO42240.1 hypothetical protein SAMN06265171_101693 [Chryseobacterium rhizoplanae]
MEQMIIIGLLVILVLVLVDKKISISIRGKDNVTKTKDLPSIMGDTKPRERQESPIESNERQYESNLTAQDNFESETEDEYDNVAGAKNLDDILVRNDELEQENEDWKYENSTIESGFATGVTFQELSTVGQLLQEQVLEPGLQQQAVAIIQKIHGTELFDLLENSLGEASKRISNLLSQSISNDVEGISSSYKDGVEGFDIGEFV